MEEEMKGGRDAWGRRVDKKIVGGGYTSYSPNLLHPRPESCFLSR